MLSAFSPQTHLPATVVVGVCASERAASGSFASVGMEVAQVG